MPTAFVPHHTNPGIYASYGICRTRVTVRVYSGVTCRRQAGLCAARRTGAGSAGQIQCAGQKVDKLKSSPSSVILLKLTFRPAFSGQTPTLRFQHSFSRYTPWITLRPEEHPPLISKASPSPGSNARARAVPRETRQPRSLCVTRETDCEMSSDGPPKAQSKSSKL